MNSRMNKFSIFALAVMALSLVLVGCVEELDASIFLESREDTHLVVEAQLTDELKRQEVVLSRSRLQVNLERDTVYDPYMPMGMDPEEDLVFERNASVQVENDQGMMYTFTEEQPGKYLSDTPFALKEGIVYTLIIRTWNGNSYRSEPISLFGEASLQSIYAEKAVNADGIAGIQVYADSELLKGDSAPLRFTYEETYKIVAPFWSPDEFRLTDYDPCDLPEPTYILEIIPREVQNRVCYNTVPSSSILQEKLSISQGGKLRKFPLRFIPKEDFITAERYSILVRQLVQSPEAYRYFQTLDRIATSTNPFTQVQPGTLTANLMRVDGAEEPVLGYVEAVSVKEQRIYFSFHDFFPGEPLPSYPFTCFEQSSPESHQSYCSPDPSTNSCPPSIVELIDHGRILYSGENNEFIGICPGPYTYVKPECGDCTFLGENVKPEFWED